MEDEELIGRLRLRMKTQGIGAKALSLKAGLNDTYVRDILKGKSRNPRNAHLQKLALALECQVSDLTGELDSADGSELEREVLAGLRSTDKQGQEMIRRFVRSLNRDDPPSAPSPRANGPEQPRPVTRPDLPAPLAPQRPLRAGSGRMKP